MSTAYALICGGFFYGFLFLLGRATTAIFRFQSDSLEALSLSPIIGLAVLTLLSTYLVLIGIPLGIVSKNVAIAIAIFATIIVASPVTRDLKYNGTLTLRQYLLPLSVAVLLIALPLIKGGYQFAILRGNGTDAFNYVTIADALSRYPLDWILSQTKETLAFQSANLPFAQDLLKTRWSTSALLAFASSAFGISPVEFEYVFTLTLMVVLFNALVTALSATCSLTRLTVWLPVVFVAGFWGQFTLDIRAFSQIGSLPIVVVLIGWLLSHVKGPGSVFCYGVSLTAILSAALFLQYPEIVAAFLPGAGLIFLIRLWLKHRENNLKIKDFRAIVTVLFFTFLLSAPQVKFIIGFALEQGRFAVNKSLGWEAAYFSWMKNPIRGLWGCGVDPGFGLNFDRAFASLSFLTALCLTLCVVIRVVMLISTHQWKHKQLSETGLLLIATSGLMGATLLVTRGNIWAAGKIISYFAILIPIWMAICLSSVKIGIANSRCYKATSYVIVLSICSWGAINFVFAGARIAHATNESDFPGYITNHGEYRSVNAGAIARIPHFNYPIGSSVAIFEPTVWGREFLTHIVEGRKFTAFTPGFLQNRSSKPDESSMPVKINWVLANRKYFDASSLPPATNNGVEFVAAALGEHFAALVALEGGYGVELNRVSSTYYVWTGQQDVQLTLLANASSYNVGLKLCPGVIRGAKEKPLTIYVEIDGERVSQHEVRNCTDVDVELVGKNEIKLQKIRLTISDPRPDPTLIGIDPRDLRLRVEVSKVSLKYIGP